MTRMQRIEEQFAYMEMKFLLNSTRDSDRRQVNALVRAAPDAPRPCRDRLGSLHTHFRQVYSVRCRLCACRHCMHLQDLDRTRVPKIWKCPITNAQQHNRTCSSALQQTHMMPNVSTPKVITYSNPCSL